MSAVNIAGTFKKDSRPDNGLEAYADDIIDHELASWVIVGVVTSAGYSKKPGEAPVPRVKPTSIEVVTGDDAIIVRELIDKARANRNNAPLETSLFDADGWVRDKPEGDDE